MRNGWRKSSFSNGNGGNNCVEIYTSPLDGAVVVRDSKLCMWFENLIADPQFDTLQFTRDEWVAFVQGVKAGEFDGSE